MRVNNTKSTLLLLQWDSSQLVSFILSTYNLHPLYNGIDIQYACILLVKIVEFFSLYAFILFLLISTFSTFCMWFAKWLQFLKSPIYRLVRFVACLEHCKCTLGQMLVSDTLCNLNDRLIVRNFLIRVQALLLPAMHLECFYCFLDL